MGSIGIEKLLLLGIALMIFFGPNKLPELGKALGKGIQEFKKASRELTDSVKDDIAEDGKDEKK
jgi:sec-independent protein translocase protein TatA